MDLACGANNAAMRRGYIDGPFGQLHVREAGRGVPLLLLHQSPLNGGMFAAASAELSANGFHVIAPDTPGYGQSDAPENPVQISAYADCLHSVLNHFGYETACILGHHTGAVIAANFAARFGDTVRHLVLNGVPLLSEEERAFFATFKFSPLDIKADGSHLQAAWEQRLKASPGWTNLAAMHRYTVDMLANPERYFWAFDAVFAHDLATDLAAITCPTTLLTNTGEDLFQATKRTHAQFPHFGFESLEGGTHDIVDEQPEAWANKLVRILASSHP
ncbi:MAG: alpha/beta hydrolase [Pseudomonadota bacterium]